jgi:hypothetical protein
VHGINYEPAEKPKSDIYRDLLPSLNSGRAELLDLPRLSAQLCGLERRTARGGRDSLDHGPGAHDDIANAVAGVLVRTVGDGLEVWRRLGAEAGHDAARLAAATAGRGELRGAKASWQIAAELTARAVSTPRGGQWHPQTVIRVLDRIGAITPDFSNCTC